MKNPRLVFGMTHAAFRQAEQAVGESSSGPRKVRERQTDGGRSVDQILAIISPTKTSDQAEISPGDSKAAEKYSADFEELVRTMTVPDDIKAAIEAEMKLWEKDGHGQSAKLAALLYFWSEKDFSGLLKWADRIDEGNAMALAYHIQKIVEKTIEVKGTHAILGLPKNENWSGNLMYYVGSTLGKSGDTGQLAEAKGSLNPREWQNFRGYVAGNWPWAERSKLVEFAISENAPDIISRLAGSQREKSSEASAWLLELMNDETLDAGFRDKLAKEGAVKSLANGDPEMPLATRLALLRAGDSSAQPEQKIADQLATNDVRNVLRGAQDWSYEFRHGAMEADEVLAAFSAKFPDQAAKAPDAVRNALFEELIEEDSKRAMDLLKGLSPEGRSKSVLEAARNAFFQVDPNHFLTALQQVPPDDPALWDARLDAWVKHGPDNYIRLDTDYVDWVRALPEGVDRDMALYSLAMASQERNPSLAKELRGEVKNAKIKQKIGGVQ
jgi:hypothetical protein